ncbi:MAG: right-handed parallel beta-helix repeat-containing protein, partial [Candidatus Thorarchaeota archaeon]
MKHDAVLVCVLLLATALNGWIGPLSTQQANPECVNLNSQSYVEHGAIHITSDADFENQAWPGNGTEDNPYRIEGLNITTDSVCVNITGTNAFFVIQDCLFASSSNADYSGVHLTNVSHGTVKECTITMLDSGISIIDSVSIDIKSNTIFDVQSAISSWGLNACNISLNEIYNCTWGIQSWFANDTLLTHNTVYDYRLYGFMVGGPGSDNIVAYNDIHSSKDQYSEAAILYDSPAWVIEHNSIHDCFEGIEIWFSGWMSGKMIIRENSFQMVTNTFDI